MIFFRCKCGKKRDYSNEYPDHFCIKIKFIQNIFQGVFFLQYAGMLVFTDANITRIPRKYLYVIIVERGQDVTTTATALKVTVGELSVPYIGYQLCPW